MSAEMYAVVEFNQASRRPEFADTEVYDDRDDALDSAAEFRKRAVEMGRRESYVVATVDWDSEDVL